MFEILKFLNDNLANGTAQKVYEGLMGKTWFAKLKLNIKTGAKKIGDAAKKTGTAIKKGAMKIHAKVKTGLKIKAPKVKVTLKSKVSTKAKGQGSKGPKGQGLSKG